VFKINNGEGRSMIWAGLNCEVKKAPVSDSVRMSADGKIGRA
jgi:hypothetical protein